MKFGSGVYVHNWGESDPRRAIICCVVYICMYVCVYVCMVRLTSFTMCMHV